MARVLTGGRSVKPPRFWPVLIPAIAIAAVGALFLRIEPLYLRFAVDALLGSLVGQFGVRFVYWRWRRRLARRHRHPLDVYYRKGAPWN